MLRRFHCKGAGIMVATPSITKALQQRKFSPIVPKDFDWVGFFATEGDVLTVTFDTSAAAMTGVVFREVDGLPVDSDPSQF